MLNLVVGYSYYNDLKSIKRGIPTFIDHVDHVFAIDGRYSLNEGVPDYSDDGSTEYLSQFPNVTIKQFVGYEQDKRNQYVDMCKKGDVLWILDSDEYVMKADWGQFRANLENVGSGIFGIQFDIPAKGGITEYPIIWSDPTQWRYHEAHRIFKSSWGEIRTSGTGSEGTIEGVILGHDDKLRSKEWLYNTNNYQKKMFEYELKARVKYHR